MVQSKEVLIVHCVDTEGPITESLSATFDRLYEMFGIHMQLSEENLRKLQNGEIQFESVDPQVLKRFVSKKQIKFVDTWEKLEAMLTQLFSHEMRYLLPDSAGRPYIYNWFILDFVGFKTNPRRRCAGYHHLFDYYQNFIRQYPYRDIIMWHYHHPPFDRSGTKTGNLWYENNQYDDILSRKIIDRAFFPSVYRPGEHFERNDVSFWLENWIPFDYANRALDTTRYAYTQPDDDGRKHDWRRATYEWEVYHPDFYDYQKLGNMRRSIARVLDVMSRYYTIDTYEVEKAFQRAKKGLPTVLAVTNHDVRDMVKEHCHFISILKEVIPKYPDVKYYYCNAVETMRSYWLLPLQEPGDIHIEIKDSKCFIQLSKKPFGPQPYFCFKDILGNYYHDNLVKESELEWFYFFSNIQAVEAIGVAFNDDTGNTSVLSYIIKSGHKSEKKYDYRSSNK